MKKAFLIIVAMLVLQLSSTQANAGGLGFYLSGGSGSSDIDYDYWWSISNSVKSDVDLGSVGLVFDTNLSKDALFNYRLELGKGNYKWKAFPLGTEHEFDQTVMTHDFGFGILRTQSVRLWLGPEIRLSKINDTVDGYDLDMFGFGFGLALGLNINVLDPVTFSVKASFLNQTMNGDLSYDDPVFGLLSDDISTDDDISMVTAAIIFRFGETY